MKGHWFCSKCQDVVFLRPPVGRWDTRINAPCPVCNTYSADWIADAVEIVPTVEPEPEPACVPAPKCISREEAARQFAKLRSEFNPGGML